MSRRSVASSTYSHERRKSKHRVTDEDLFKCVCFPIFALDVQSCSRLSAVQLRSSSRVRSCLSITPGRDCPDGNITARYLSYLILPKPTNPATSTSTSNGDALREKEKEREHSSRISGAISHSITSIGDVFRDVTAREGSKNVKFPEKLIKVLEQRLENIAMGKDPAYVLSPRAIIVPLSLASC